mgnify:CR=1 FL=1
MQHDRSSSENSTPTPSTSGETERLERLKEHWEKRDQRRNQAHVNAGLFPVGELPQSAPEDFDLVPIASIEADDDPPRTRTPASGVTGVTNRSQGAPRRAGDTRAPGSTDDFTPDESGYFDSLRVDTLKLSARVDRDSVDELQDVLSRRKERARQEDECTTLDAHDGTELHVRGSTPDDNRKVLLDGGPIVVTAMAQENIPWLSFTFRAAACWQNDVDELVQWARDFAAFYGIEIMDTLVSRLDLCTDVDERFYGTDTRKLSGRFSNQTAVYRDRGKVHAITYERTSDRPVCWRIYDKRHEVDDRDGRSFWPEVWDAHDVDEDAPIWRVEFEAKRARLRERGIDSWEDLTAENVNAFWTYCTEEFTHMDRQVWDRVQDVTVEEAAERADVDSIYDPERMELQIMGMARRIAREEDRSIRDVLDDLPDKYLDSS